MGTVPSSYKAYKQVDIETASQGKLIVMLFNGAIQRSSEATRLMENGGTIADIHNNLIRAQDIITELRGALDLAGGGEIAGNLDRSYEYMHHLLVQANVNKDTDALAECIELMTVMRDTWQEVFDTTSKDEGHQSTPTINQHGSTLMNLKG